MSRIEKKLNIFLFIKFEESYLLSHVLLLQPSHFFSSITNVPFDDSHSTLYSVLVEIEHLRDRYRFPPPQVLSQEPQEGHDAQLPGTEIEVFMCKKLNTRTRTRTRTRTHTHLHARDLIYILNLKTPPSPHPSLLLCFKLIVGNVL